MEKGDIFTSKPRVNTSEATTGSLFHVSARSLKVPGMWATPDVTSMDEILEYGIEKEHVLF